MSYFSSLGSILTQVGKVVLDEVDRALEDDTENDDRLETTEDDDFDNKDNDNELDIQHVKAPAIIGVDINSSSYTEEKISGVSLLESEDDSSFAEVNLDSDMKEVNESPHQCPYPELSLSYISNNKKGLSAEKGIESEKLSEVMKANIVDDDTDDPQEELAQRKLFQSPQIFITPASDGSSIDRRRLVELEVVVSKLREENSNLHKNLKAKTNELHSLTNQVTTLEAKASENEEYILEVQDQAKETELLQLKQMHDIVSGSKERFNQEISEKDSQIEQLKSQLAEAISSMQSIQVLPTADSQSQSNQLLSDELQSLQTIIRERDNTISHLNAQLQAGNEDIRLHEKKIYTLQQRVQALESTEVEIAQERATHKLNLIEYEDRLRTAEELVWAAKAENAELIFAHEIGTKKIEILQASEDQLKSESVLLQEELSQIKSLFAAQQEQLTQQEQIRSSVVIDSASASSNDLDSVLKALSLLVINIDESFTEEINWPEQALELLSTVSDANIRSSVQSLGLYVLRLQQQLRVFKDTQSAHEVVATVAKELGLSTDSHTGENTVTELEEKLSEMTTRYIEMTALSTSWVETFEQKLAEAHAVRELLEAQLQESQARDAERLVLEQKLAEAVSKRESVEKELRDMQMREVEVQQRAVNRDALEQQLLEVQQQFAQTESTLSTVKQQLAK